MSWRKHRATDELRIRLCRAAFGMLAMLAAGLSSVVVAQPEYSGHFEVRTASHELRDGVYYVNALIDLRLSSEATEALHAGLPLTIRVDVEFLNRLRLWWDTLAASVSRRSLLTYTPITDRYVVRSVNTGDRRSFPSLSAALDYLGRVDDLPVVDASVLDDDMRYDIRVRAVLDTDELPGPLRLIAFWRNQWSIDSDWLQWRLDDE